MTAYLAPAGPAEAELREKGSRFLGFVLPVADEEAARAALEELQDRFAGATHHCWAWRLGAEARERSSDAGEPAGTAGVPMLQVLRGAGLSDVLAVAVRWFGGTKLGKGGLARAYAGVVRAALESLPVAERVPTVDLVLDLPFERLGAVKRLVHPPEVEIAGETYGEQVRLVLRVRADRADQIVEALASHGIGPSGVGPSLSP